LLLKSLKAKGVTDNWRPGCGDKVPLGLASMPGDKIGDLAELRVHKPGVLASRLSFTMISSPKCFMDLLFYRT